MLLQVLGVRGEVGQQRRLRLGREDKRREEFLLVSMWHRRLIAVADALQDNIGVRPTESEAVHASTTTLA